MKQASNELLAVPPPNLERWRPGDKAGLRACAISRSTAHGCYRLSEEEFPAGAMYSTARASAASWSSVNTSRVYPADRKLLIAASQRVPARFT